MACRGLHRHAVEQPSRRWRAGHDSRSAAKYQDVRHDGVVLVHARYDGPAVDPVDAVNTVPRGVLRSRIERLVLDVDAHRFATSELPRRDGQDAAAAAVIQK